MRRTSDAPGSKWLLANGDGFGWFENGLRENVAMTPHLAGEAMEKRAPFAACVSHAIKRKQSVPQDSIILHVFFVLLSLPFNELFERDSHQ